MSIFDDIQALASNQTDFSVYPGYPTTDAVLPYVAHRPLILGEEGMSIAGVVIDWDYQSTFYCAAESSEASFNLAIELIKQLQGKPVGGTVLSTSVGYIGAQVEGHYESQVTVQLNQGGI